MYTKNEIRSNLEKVAVKLTDNFGAGGIGETISDVNLWEWELGVGMFGLYKYYKLSGERKYWNYMLDWYDKRIETGLPKRLVNTTAPLLALAYIAEENGNQRYLDICIDWAEWLLSSMERTTDGGFQHTVAGTLDTTEQLWDDTLYMAVLFLGKMGTVTNRRDFTEEAIKQYLVHIKYLFDRGTGLWFHGWTFKERCNFSATRWARGNCWITAGLVDFFDMVEISRGVKEYLIDTLKTQVEVLAELQHASGLWHTVLDDTDSYVEASAAAGFGYGILKGVRKGYIDAKYRETAFRALDGIMKNIKEDGTVDNVSIGTPVYWEEDKYKQIPIGPRGYGQALALLFLGEVLNH